MMEEPLAENLPHPGLVVFGVCSAQPFLIEYILCGLLEVPRNMLGFPLACHLCVGSQEEEEWVVL